jgi:hypothetical protein
MTKRILLIACKVAEKNSESDAFSNVFPPSLAVFAISFQKFLEGEISCISNEVPPYLTLHVSPFATQMETN